MINCIALSEKNTNLVSRILFQLHHLSSQVITELILLPTLECVYFRKTRASSPQHSFTWHYSTQGLPPAHVTICSRELLPHVFTFSTPKRVVIFCGTFSFPKNWEAGV